MGTLLANRFDVRERGKKLHFNDSVKLTIYSK